MDAAQPSAAPQDLSKLSDQELLRLCRAERGEKAFAHELWGRYQGAVRSTLNRLVFIGGLCPFGTDKRSFYDASLSRAYLKFLPGICNAEIRRSLGGWFKRLTYTAAIEEWRHITHRRGVADKDAETDEDLNIAASSDREALIGDPSVLDSLSFRSEYLPERWWLRSYQNPEAEVLARESAQRRAKRSEIVRDLMISHAAVSEESFLSSHWIRLRHWKDWTLAQIGAYVYGVPANNRERNTQEKRVSRKLCKDYVELRVMLEDRFGVTSFHELMTVI